MEKEEMWGKWKRNVLYVVKKKIKIGENEMNDGKGKFEKFF